MPLLTCSLVTPLSIPETFGDGKFRKSNLRYFTVAGFLSDYSNTPAPFPLAI